MLSSLIYPVYLSPLLSQKHNIRRQLLPDFCYCRFPPISPLVLLSSARHFPSTGKLFPNSISMSPQYFQLRTSHISHSLYVLIQSLLSPTLSATALDASKDSFFPTVKFVTFLYSIRNRSQKHYTSNHLSTVFTLVTSKMVFLSSLVVAACLWTPALWSPPYSTLRPKWKCITLSQLHYNSSPIYFPLLTLFLLQGLYELLHLKIGWSVLRFLYGLEGG